MVSARVEHITSFLAIRTLFQYWIPNPWFLDVINKEQVLTNWLACRMMASDGQLQCQQEIRSGTRHFNLRLIGTGSTQKTHPDMTEKLLTGWRNKSSIIKYFGSRLGPTSVLNPLNFQWSFSCVSDGKTLSNICPFAWCWWWPTLPLARGHLIQKGAT